MTSPLHGVLLRLAGGTPDGILTALRRIVAELPGPEAARAVAAAVVAESLPLASADVALLTGLLTGHPLADMLADLPATPPPPVPAFTAEPVGVAPTLDDTDRVATATATGLPGAATLWRSSRAGDRATRVFVLEMTGDLAAGTARMQQALEAVGELDPQVETVAPDEEPPAYQRAARAAGSLLWSAMPAAPVRIARVFDRVDAQAGPVFEADHPRLDAAEVDGVLAYLRDGLPLLVTTQSMPDVVDPAAPAIVPMSFRTDGSWIWTDTVSYYAERYGLAPDPELLAHIRQVDFRLLPVDAVAAYRAAQELHRPADAEPAWTVG